MKRQHGGGVRRAEKRGGGVNEWNGSRCVTEDYITLSLHTHGAGTHTHAGGQPHTPLQVGDARGGAQNQGAECTMLIGHGVPHSHLCASPPGGGTPEHPPLGHTQGLRVPRVHVELSSSSCHEHLAQTHTAHTAFTGCQVSHPVSQGPPQSSLGL